MSPLEIWCNEAQERYVLAIAPGEAERFAEICRRERCPHAVVGTATADDLLVLHDSHFGNLPIEMPTSVLLGKPPKMQRTAEHVPRPDRPLRLSSIEMTEAVERVLTLPGVADKTFLVTIGDRTVTGLIARDPMVGPWQVPVADAAVTATSYEGYTGEAMSIGERPPIALLDAAASARMAVGEAITNLMSAPVESMSHIKLSANWMAPAGYPGEDANLFDAVRTVGTELCPALGIAIPVGKDSMSMRTVWRDARGERSVTAPLSLIVSAFGPVTDIRKTLTPELRTDVDATELILIDLGRGRNRLGGSALAQVYGALGTDPPDLDDPALLRGMFTAVRRLNELGLILAYHDRSDGGLFVTLLEMAFAGNTGVRVDLAPLVGDPRAVLFNEELGAVLQVRTADVPRVRAELELNGLGACSHRLGSRVPDDRISIVRGDQVVFEQSRTALRAIWSDTTFRMQMLRDDPGCAEEEQSLRVRAEDPGLSVRSTFDWSEDVAATFVGKGARPRIAVLREQGVNGHIEMAAAFDRAGFEAVDVHMSDLLEGRTQLDGFHGLVACGGFSYGDVLGAGEGWAKSILFHPRARDAFARFFQRTDTFTLGVCNGCQMVANLRELIPGAEDWPRFVRNRSDQFEGRLTLVRVEPSPSVLLRGMDASWLPVAVAHGEGRAEFATDQQRERLEAAGLIAVRYIDHLGRATEHYPENPNGSPQGITALTTPDGRVTIMMPHPERVFRAVQMSWRPHAWQKEDGPWMRLFRNARAWVRG